MKVIKFIIIVVVITGICFGVPCFMYENMDIQKYWTYPEGSSHAGMFGYIVEVMKDKDITPEICQKVTNLINEYNRINNGTREENYKIIFAVEMLLGISVIIIGIILLKATSKKLLAYATIVSGVLSIIGYMFLYYAYVIFL